MDFFHAAFFFPKKCSVAPQKAPFLVIADIYAQKWCYKNTVDAPQVVLKIHLFEVGLAPVVVIV